MPRLLPRGGLDGPRSTRSGGGGGGRSGGRGRGRPAVKPAAKDDDDICVVEEKLTPLAKMKAKVSWILYRRNKTGRAVYYTGPLIFIITISYLLTSIQKKNKKQRSQYFFLFIAKVSNKT